jgi:acyl-CoA thioesterase-1
MFASIIGPRRQGRIAQCVIFSAISDFAISAVFCLARPSKANAASPLKLVALGDSLTAGYLLPADQAFPSVLQKALRKDGFDVSVVNAGVSGDTASGGLARLDWSVPAGTDAVILELGANDMLQGIDPAVIHTKLDKIFARLTARHIKVLIAGMKAAPSLGKVYGQAFDKIYLELAAKYHAPLYPFFLAGVATHKDLTLADGMHPTGAGVDIMVRGILPQVETLLRSIPAKS